MSEGTITLALEPALAARLAALVGVHGDTLADVAVAALASGLRHLPKRPRWSPARDGELRRLWADPDLTQRAIATRLGVCEAHLYRLARRLMLPRRMRPRWSEAMLAELRRRWAAGDAVSEIARVLGQSVHSVKFKTRKLPTRERRSPARRWTPARLEGLRALWAEGRPVPEIRDALGGFTSTCGIYQKAHALGLRGRPQLRRGPRKTAPPEANGVRASAVTPPAVLEADPVAAFIAARGVTRCPTAAVTYTSAVLPATDAAAINAHEAALQATATTEAIARAARGRRGSHNGLAARVASRWAPP